MIHKLSVNIYSDHSETSSLVSAKVREYHWFEYRWTHSGRKHAIDVCIANFRLGNGWVIIYVWLSKWSIIESILLHDDALQRLCAHIFKLFQSFLIYFCEGFIYGSVGGFVHIYDSAGLPYIITIFFTITFPKVFLYHTVPNSFEKIIWNFVCKISCIVAGWAPFEL